jgi:DNA modification methylase
MPIQLIQGDCLEEIKKLPDQSVQCCVTSPPYYGLRDYGMDGQIGLEQTPEEYVAKLVEIFREVRRVLKDDGTLWLNLGDSYAHSLRQAGEEHAGELSRKSKGIIKEGYRPLQEGYKEKDLIGIPWMVAFALRDDGWWLRSDIIWNKTNPMPESVQDRPMKSHEYIFLFSKNGGKSLIWKAADTEEWSYNPDISEKLFDDDNKKYVPRWKGYDYYYDNIAILEPANFDGRKDTYCKGSNKYKNGTQTFAKEAHERWPNKIRGFKTKDQLEDQNPQHHGNDIDCYYQDGLPARNKRDVWTISTQPYKEAHFATYPQKLIEPCILAGCPMGGVVLDPFNGAGTTGVVCLQFGRKYIGIELNPQYIKLSEKRFTNTQLQFSL